MTSNETNDHVPIGEEVLATMDRDAADAENYRRDASEAIADQGVTESSKARTAVAALLTREAALVAEVAGLREDIADRNRTIACKNIDIRERDASLHGWAEQAKKAEAERDALAAEVGALREDAERWREVNRRFDESSTRAASLTLEGLDLEPTPYCSLSEIVDAARVSTAAANAEAAT